MATQVQPLKWHGGKSYLARWIHSLASPSVSEDKAHGYTHRNYPFAGGLGELWGWECEGISEAANDIDGSLCGFWRCLQSKGLFAEFKRTVDAIPFSQREFEEWLLRGGDNFEKYPYPAAVGFFIRFRQSRQGLGKDYATPTTRTRRGMNENVSAWLSAVEGLPECHERLKRVEIRNLDALEFIKKYDHPRALFYCDPPYLHETRSSTGEYGENEMSEDDHTALLASLSAIKGRFMLSGYNSDTYAEIANLCDWNRHEKTIDNKASSKKTKPKKVECVWTNY